MTNEKAKIYRKIVKYKKMDKILEKTKFPTPYKLQDAIDSGSVNIADITDPQTEVTLSDAFLEELEQRRRQTVDTWITRILAVAALIISVVALFRPC